MTVPRYGRATPIQMHMLGLGGEICRWFAQQPPTDEDRMKELRSSRDALRESIGCDFGYDLQAWHDYLLNSQRHSEEYTFAFAWRAVRPKILELIIDPDRMRLVRLIEALAIK